MLNLLAIRLAEIRERLTRGSGQRCAGAEEHGQDAMEATIAAVNDKARDLAQAVAAQKNFVFVADGPQLSYGAL
ncbi:MAG: hypothetical protein R3A44_07885 [Caldilineaceae bacterium]